MSYGFSHTGASVTGLLNGKERPQRWPYIPVRRKDLGLCVGTVAYMCFLLTEMFLPKEQMQFNYQPVVPVGRCGDKGEYSTHGRHPPPCLALPMPDPGPFGTPSQPRVSTHLGGSIYPREYRQGVGLGRALSKWPGMRSLS